MTPLRGAENNQTNYDSDNYNINIISIKSCIAIIFSS